MAVVRQLGQYQILEKLGAGSAASVFRARHMLLGTEHAVKILDMQNASIAQRFIREAQVQARLRHPNIVPVTDLFQEGEQVAMVMAFIPGGTLDALLRTEGALPLGRALQIFLKLLEATQYAHEQGVLHRDIKPSNVLMKEDEPCLADFGLARWASASERLTGEGLAMGTPGYMPPELWTDPGSADARTDVFGLAALLFEMLSGRRPFVGKNFREILDNTAIGSRPDLRELVPGLPEHVVAAIDRALEPDRTKRLSDCAIFAAALSRPTLAPLPDSVQPAPIPVDAPPPAEPTLHGLLNVDAPPPPAVTPRPSVKQAPAWRRYIPTQGVVLALTVLLIGVLVADPRSGPALDVPTGMVSPDVVVPTLPVIPKVDLPEDEPPEPDPGVVTGPDPPVGRQTGTAPKRGCSGWIYANFEQVPAPGEYITLSAATNVRDRMPEAEDRREPRTRCTLPAGTRVQIGDPPVQVVGDHYWVPVDSRKLKLP